MRVKKAVIPVAGFGTRMLPASKAIPKEMLPVVDRPAIQLVIEEAAAAGLTEILLVTHPAKKAIEDHFDVQAELEAQLASKGKTALLQQVTSLLPKGVSLAAVRQGQALGLGHAVACAAPWIGAEPFAVLLPDVLVDSRADSNDLGQMVTRFAASGHAQIMVEAVARERVDQYGIVTLTNADSLAAGASAAMTGIVEKPAPATAPSNLAVVGRYVFPAALLPLLAKVQPGKGGEIQLTDGIAALLQQEVVEAWCLAGQTFDCGNKLGYLEAILHYGLRHAEVGAGLRELLAKLGAGHAG